MDATAMFTECLREATMTIKQVRPDQFGAETPDTEWNVRDLCQHMLYELSWVADLVNGKTIADVGDAYEGDLFNDNDDLDLAHQWDLAAARAETAVAALDPEGTAHLSYGEVPVEQYVREVSGDLLIHAWDLGQAIGVTIMFAPQVTQAIYDYMAPRAEGMVSSGLFAAPVPVGDDASPEVRLLALTGRSVNWRS